MHINFRRDAGLRALKREITMATRCSTPVFKRAGREMNMVILDLVDVIRQS